MCKYMTGNTEVILDNNSNLAENGEMAQELDNISSKVITTEPPSSVPRLASDISARAGTYADGLRNCSAISFAGGNGAYALASGTVGGFELGALPAVTIQAIILAWVAGEQINATYKGEGYNTPFKRLALANWATAGALVCGSATTGNPVAVAISVLPAAVIAAWGLGHWELGRMIHRIEQISKEGKKAGLKEIEINQRITADRMVAKFSARFQQLYGAADLGAIATAANKGANVKSVIAQNIHGLTQWQSFIPLAVIALGLTKSFSKTASNILDRITPGFMKTAKGEVTANRYYGAGYLLAALGGLATELAAQGANHMSPAIFLVKSVPLVAAYLAWAHAYFALDANKKPPMSALQYQDGIASQSRPALTLG